MNGTLNLGQSLSASRRPNLHNSYFFINKLFKHLPLDLNLCPVINNELLIRMLLYEPPEGLFPDTKIQGCLFYRECVLLPPRQRNVFSYYHSCKSSCQKICSNTENRDFLLRNIKLLCQPLFLYNQQLLFYRQTELHYLCLSWYMIFFPNSIFPQSNSSVFVTFLIMTIQKELLVYEKSFLYCTFYYFSIAFFISLIFLFLSMFSYSKKQSNNI